MAAAPIVTLDELKNFLQIPTLSTGRDARLSLILNGVNTFIAKRTGRDLQEAPRVDKFAGTGTRTMQLRHYPIASITSILEDGTTIDATDPEIVEILTEIGVLIRVDSVWLRSIERIYTITYVAGPTPDDDLQLACLQMCAWMHRTSGVVGDDRFSGRASKTFVQSLSELPGASEIIDSYSDSARGFMGGIHV